MRSYQRLLLVLSSLLFLQLQGSVNPNSEELKTVVRIARHGDRNPNNLYPWAADPSQEFLYAGDLTRAGEKQHWDIGQHMREKYIYNQNNFLSEEYNPYDVFAMSSVFNRTFTSIMYELRGLYPHGKSFDDYHTTEENSHFSYPFTATSLELQEDQLILVDCGKKFAMWVDAQACDEFAIVLDYFEEVFLPRFKEIVGQDDIDMHQLRDMCIYIYWAQKANLKLKYDFTPEDINYCLAFVDTEGYYSEYGIKEMKYLWSYDFVRIQEEIGTHLVYGTPIMQLPVLNKYYSIPYGSDVGIQFPMMIDLDGHATTMWPLLDTLGFHQYPEVPPASGVYIEYWRHRTQHSVKMFYEVINVDGSYTQYPMWFPGQTEDKLPLDDFLAHLDFLMKDVHYTDIVQECQSPYVSTGIYFSGEETLTEILKAYGLPLPDQGKL